MSADGRTLIDNTGVGADRHGLLEQPEVREALLTGWGQHTRRLGEDAYDSRVVAVRAGDDESMLGVVWLSRPTWTIAAAWQSLGKLVTAIGAIALVGTFAMAISLTYLRTRLLRRLTETARSLSAGDLSARANIVGSDEYATLSSALNQMRKRLAQQVETIDRQRLTLRRWSISCMRGVVVGGRMGASRSSIRRRLGCLDRASNRRAIASG